MTPPPAKPNPPTPRSAGLLIFAWLFVGFPLAWA